MNRTPQVPSIYKTGSAIMQIFLCKLKILETKSLWAERLALTEMNWICSIYVGKCLIAFTACPLSFLMLGLLQEQYEILKNQDNKVKQGVWEHEECDNVTRQCSIKMRTVKKGF